MEQRAAGPGFRVYQVNGTRRSCGHSGRRHATYQANRLTPASTVSFVVEAYNGSRHCRFGARQRHVARRHSSP